MWACSAKWKNKSFYDELKSEWDIHIIVDLAVCFGDFNGHMSMHIGGFDSVYGGYGVGQSFERMLLEFCL